MKAYNKFKYYVYKFIVNVKWIRLLIIPATFVILISNYLNIECTKLAASIGNNMLNVKSELAMFAGLIITADIVNYIVDIFIAYFVASSIKRAYNQFFVEYLSVKMKDLYNLSIGDIHYDIQRRSIALSDFFNTLTVRFISNFVFFLFVLYKLLINLYFFSALKILSCFLIFISLVIYSQKLKTNLRSKVNLGFQKNSRKIYDILLNYERIKAYHNKKIESEKYSEVTKDQEYYGKLFWTSFEFIYCINTVIFALLTALIIYEFKQISTHTSVQIAQIIGIVNALNPKISELTYSIDQLCFHFTNLDQSLLEGIEPEDPGQGIMINSFNNEITLEKLKFSKGDRIILSNINLNIVRGEKIAVVGISGMGKSLFLKLLSGIQTDYDGQIKIDGFEYSLINLGNLRRRFAYISQEPAIIGTTIHNNLQIGQTTISDKEMVQLSQEFGYHSLFRDIGYQKEIATSGKNLSGGQKQKINFMRAIIKDSDILVFDEPTASMDTKSEMQVYKSFNSKLKDKTLIITVNNLHYLSYFDAIIYFDENNSVVKSSFNDLMQNNQLFQDFYASNLKVVKQEQNKV